MPNVPHIELDLAANYAIAKIKEAVIAVTGRWYSGDYAEVDEPVRERK